MSRRVRIEAVGGNPRATRVLVDGLDISRFVTGISVHLAHDGDHAATVDLLPPSLCVDLPADAVELVHDWEPERTP